MPKINRSQDFLISLLYNAIAEDDIHLSDMSLNNIKGIIKMGQYCVSIYQIKG